MTLNHERWVTHGLDAIASQTIRDIELIVTDDASTDNTPTLLRLWLSKSPFPSQLIAHSDRRGICATLNEALSCVSGHFVAIVSLDDVLHPTHLEARLRAFSQSPPETAVIYGDAELIDDNGNSFHRTYLRSGQPGRPTIPPPTGNVFRDLITADFIPAPTALIRRTALSEIGPYDESLLYEDYDMWLRLAKRYTFAYTDDVTVDYRVHRNSFFRTLRRQRQYIDTEFRLLHKALGHDREADLNIYARLQRLARASYFTGNPNGRAHLRTLLNLHYTPQTALLVAFSALPIPPRFFRCSRSAVRTFRTLVRAYDDSYLPEPFLERTP